MQPSVHSTPHTPNVQWDYPAPRGMLDRFIGPGATRAELWLQFSPALLSAIAWLVAALRMDWGWSPLQIAMVMLLSIDLVGGVATNATSSAKRWYHREGQGFRQHFGFVLIHVHPFLVMALFDPGNWQFALGSYGYLLAGALAILASPLYLRRPLALLLLLGGSVLSLYVLPIPVQFEWFLPVFYTKLFASHLLREEPYRPAGAPEPGAMAESIPSDNGHR
jgi:hypothetical protein